MSTERVIVDSSISKDFEAALREAAQSIVSKRFNLVRKGAVEDLKSTVEDALKSVSQNYTPDITHLCSTSHHPNLLMLSSRGLVISSQNQFTTIQPHHPSFSWT